MFVIPLQFTKYHKQMLAHFKEMLEYRNGLMAIHPIHNKLKTVKECSREWGGDVG